MSAERAALGAAAPRFAGRHLAACLREFPPYLEASVLVAYLALGNEVPTDVVIADALRRGKRVFVPGVAQRWFVRHDSASIGCSVDGAGAEPAAGEPLDRGERSGVVLVPLLAWSPGGDRLGRGGGWYDRVLPMLAMPSIGVGYDFQQRVHVPTEPSDVRLDYVVTESRMVHCGAGVHSERRLT